MIKIDNFAVLVNQYDTFFVDIWGTIWDGEKLFPWIADSFLALKAQGKKIVLLSNYPGLEKNVGNMLAGNLQKGVHFDEVITSGSFFKDLLQNGWFEKTLNRDDYHYFIFGEGQSQVLEPFHAHHTHDLNEAHVVFIGALINPFIPIAQDLQTQQFLRQVLDKNLPIVCINPDRNSVRGKKLILTQGAIADAYEQMGGQVYYFGKPYAGIFNFACEKMQADKKRSIMVGDGLTTDIAGAHACGMDSVLLTGTGLLSLKTPKMIDNILARSPFKPTYVADRLY